MALNVEIKARIADPEGLRRAVAAKSDSPVEVIEQEDVFFGVAQGRLKLRVFGPGRGELIHYHRPDVPGPTTSSYTIAPTSDPAALHRILAATLPVVGTVRKRRLLYRFGQTRVHLDRVEGLGDFLELEVVLASGQTESEGAEIADAILADLGIGADQLLKGAYLDLQRANEASAAR